MPLINRCKCGKAQCAHMWTTIEYVAPECLHDGSECLQCLMCGEYQINTLPALGHDPLEDMGYPGTYYCGRCGQLL